MNALQYVNTFPDSRDEAGRTRGALQPRSNSNAGQLGSPSTQSQVGKSKRPSEMFASSGSSGGGLFGGKAIAAKSGFGGKPMFADDDNMQGNDGRFFLVPIFYV